MNFKIGDRVEESGDLGTITRRRDDTSWCVKWDKYDEELWANENEMTKLTKTDNTDVKIMNTKEIIEEKFSFTVAELKKILDKMDDQLIIDVKNFRIRFNGK